MIPHHLSMFYVYILRSIKNGKCYIGLSNDLNRRLEQHNAGQSYWTRRYMPFELVYYEAYRSLEDAKERERKLKHFKKGYTDLEKRLKNSLDLLSRGGGG